MDDEDFGLGIANNRLFECSVFSVQEEAKARHHLFFLNPESRSAGNTCIIRGIETIINVDSKLKRISDMFG
jgi:hypothetical protein